MSGCTLPKIRLAKADRGKAVDVFELTYDQRLFLWCPENRPLAKKVVVKVVYAHEVPETVYDDIYYALLALANAMPGEPHHRTGRTVIQVELNAGRDAGAMVASLESMVAKLKRSGVSGTVLRELAA
ncbi:hypothetical protein GGF32_006591 [Allomyces javanicus]|nr:hypothetical protein GGF32_006591 [Allomyces javanicus]